MDELQFVHIELKRDTWVSPKMSVRDPFDAVEATRTLIENLDREEEEFEWIEPSYKWLQEV